MHSRNMTEDNDTTTAGRAGGGVSSITAGIVFQELRTARAEHQKQRYFAVYDNLYLPDEKPRRKPSESVLRGVQIVQIYIQLSLYVLWKSTVLKMHILHIKQFFTHKK